VMGLRGLRGGCLIRRVRIYDVVVMILLIVKKHLLAGFPA
jgi:hypothetical protein